MPAFPAHLPGPNNDPARPFDHIAFTMPANMTQQPAASIDCGQTPDGLPIGLQIVGPWLEDRTPLKLAELIEREFGGFVPPKGF